MQKLFIKDECTVELRDLETGEVITSFKSSVAPVAAYEEIEGQISIEELIEDMNQLNKN